jgi:hypothetical protein
MVLHNEKILHEITMPEEFAVPEPRGNKTLADEVQFDHNGGKYKPQGQKKARPLVLLRVSGAQCDPYFFFDNSTV